MTHDGCVSLPDSRRAYGRRRQGRQHGHRAAATAPAMDGSGSLGKATEHHRAHWTAKICEDLRRNMGDFGDLFSEEFWGILLEPSNK